jgi:hypothetical protein
VALFQEGSAEAAANRTAIIEFMVGDVDAEFARQGRGWCNEPKMMPSGNRSVQLRDPDGTPVSLLMPVTGAAEKRFGLR